MQNFIGALAVELPRAARWALAGTALYAACVALAAPALAENTTGGVLKPRAFKPPARTTWKPIGPRGLFVENNPVIGNRASWRAMHGDVSMSWEVTVAAAPVFKYAWTADPQLYSPFSVAVDRHDNSYYSPLWGPRRIMLISYDTRGRRRFVVRSTNPDGGCCDGPLLTDDPRHPKKQIVFAVDRGQAVAVTTSGRRLWRSASGLPAPIAPISASPGEYLGFGPNYNTKADAIGMVSGDGFVVLWDRRTGRRLLKRPFQLPGSPSPATTFLSSPEVQAVVDREFLPLLPGRPAGAGFEEVQTVLYGERVQNANHFASDPGTGRMFIASTAPDGVDGTADGLSTFGALYGVDVVRRGNRARLRIACHAYFEGGSAATPALNGGASRVYSADGVGNLLAFSRNCRPLWKFNVGDQVPGAPVVSQDNHEIYVMNGSDALKVIDRGRYAQLAWTSVLDPFAVQAPLGNYEHTSNAVAANGVMTQIGAGPTLNRPDRPPARIPFNVGVGLLDRQTGHLRYFAEGGEESIAVTVIGGDGSMYTLGSPLSRVYTRAFYPDQTTRPLQGGLTKFEPSRYDLLVRDDACAGADRTRRAFSIRHVQPAGTRADVRNVLQLIAQARGALAHATARRELTPRRAASIWRALRCARRQLRARQLESAARTLKSVCTSFPSA